MDLLFKRYASPFLLTDELICAGKFYEFMGTFIETHNEEMQDKISWEFYLHKVFDKSYTQYKESLGLNVDSTSHETEIDFGATLKESMNILGNFSLGGDG